MNPILTQLYLKYLEDDDCPGFIREVARYYLIGTIERLANSESVMTRRATVLALAYLSDFQSNPVLAGLLKDSNETVRVMTEQAIQQIWFRTGSDADQKELLVIERLNLSNQFDESLERATRLIEKNDAIAEAWNQRAIAYFNLSRYADSIRDCHETMLRNPYHYPAAIGMGQCFVEINDTYNAIESYSKALKINPGLTFLRGQINYLKKTLN